MRKSFLVTLVAALAVWFVPSSVLGSDETAEELLRRVGEMYASLERFQFEATETTITRSGDLERRTESRVVTAADESGRFRVASDHPIDGGIVAFDGETTWVYLTRRNQYREINGALLETDRPLTDPDSYDLRRLKNRFVNRYREISQRLRSAKIVSNETLSADAAEVDCVVIEASYFPPRGLATDEIIRRYWVSTDGLAIHRESSRFTTKNRRSGSSVEVTQEIVFHSVRIGDDITSSAFVSQIPPEAELVPDFENQEPPALIGSSFGFGDARDLGGETHWYSDLQGKVILLNFWATWCVPCRLELPQVESLHRELSARGLVIFGVNDEPADKALAFVEERGFTFPTLADENGNLFTGYEVRTIPTTVIVGRDGKISAYLVGSQSIEELRQAVREAGIE